MQTGGGRHPCKVAKGVVVAGCRQMNALFGLGAAFIFLLLSVPTNALALTVDNPNGGEQLRAGKTWQIQVSDAAMVTRLVVYYSLDGGRRWNRASGVQRRMAFDWRVPAVATNKDNCLIEVFGYSESGRLLASDRSDAPFSVVLLKLLTPNGRETFTPGETRPIRWELNKPTLRDGYLSVDLSTDGGSTWRTLMRRRGFRLRRYEWTIPDVVSADCAVRVRLLDLRKRTVATGTGGTFSIGMVQLRPEAQAADAETTGALTGVSYAPDGSVTLDFSTETAQLQSLAPGMVLFFGNTTHTPHGLIGRVVTRSGGPGPVTVLFMVSGIEEVIQQGSLSINEELDPSSYIFYPEPDAGVLETRIIEVQEPGIAATTFKKFEIVWKDTIKSDGGNLELIKEGKLSFTLSSEILAEFGWSGIKYLRLAVTNEQKFQEDLKIQGTWEDNLWEWQRKLGTISIPGVWTTVGGVPTYLAFSIDVYLGVKGEVSGYLRTGVEQRMSITEGVEWDHDNGTEYISESSYSSDLTPIAAGVTGSLEGYAKFQAQMLIDRVLGPTLSFSPFLKLEGSLDSSRCVDAKLKGGTRWGLGAKFKLFGKEWEWEREFEPFSKVIWEKDFCDISCDTPVQWGNYDWQRCGSKSQKTFHDASAYCQHLSEGGRTDWRLPTIQELRSLILCTNGNVVDGGYPDDQSVYSCFDGNSSGFRSPTISSDFTSEKIFYWSSTTSTDSLSRTWIWGVDFLEGFILRAQDIHWPGIPDYRAPVRCVRGG